MAEISLRRDLRPGDIGALAALHGRVYADEHDLDPTFEAYVARAAGEGDGTGRVRWFVLHPAARGAGLGGRMLAELVEQARAHRYRRLELETFSDLAAAAHRYTAAGFVRVAAVPETRWGRALLVERYELRLDG